MYEFLELIQIAKDYYKQKGETQLIKAYDNRDSLIVYPKSSENRFGASAIIIDKKTGTINTFFLPSKENFQLLRESTEIDLQEAGYGTI